MQKHVMIRFQRKSHEPTDGSHCICHVLLSEESFGLGFETVALLQRGEILPSCALVYSKLKKIFGDRKGRQEEQED